MSVSQTQQAPWKRESGWFCSLSHLQQLGHFGTRLGIQELFVKLVNSKDIKILLYSIGIDVFSTTTKSTFQEGKRAQGRGSSTS